MAKERLATELDVERLIKDNLFVANIIRILTTRRERRLAKMLPFMRALPKESITLVDNFSYSDFSSD
jgi:hypothetical protein